jgi:hypothetical protein
MGKPRYVHNHRSQASIAFIEESAESEPDGAWGILPQCLILNVFLFAADGNIC